MCDETKKNVHIDGDRSGFLTKNAVDRFKNDLKNETVKDRSAYFKEGWEYEYINENNGNTIHIKLINNNDNDNKDNKDKKISKNKVLLQVRLSDLANQRKNENQLKHHLQKQKKNDKKVPEELIDAYLKAKKVTRNPIIDPTLVCDNLDGYWQHVNGTVQGVGNASNPFATYYRMLQTYIMTEKAKQHASNS